MDIILNLWGGTITVVAMFGAFFVTGNFGPREPEKQRQYLLFAFAGLLIVLDLLLRLVQWGRMVVGARNETVLTPDGPRAPRRRWKRDVMTALFGPEAGGQYFLILPVWLLGLGLWIALRLRLVQGWLSGAD